MKSRKSRQQIRNLARQAESRPPAPPPPKPAIPMFFQQVRCACSQILRLSSSHEGKRGSCPTCLRKFVITITGDAAQGTLKIAPVYVSSSVKTGQTFLAETSQEEDVPEQLPVTCTCGRTIPAKRSMYDKRVRCPSCGARLLLTLKRDTARRYSIHPLILDDAPSGDTVLAED